MASVKDIKAHALVCTDRPPADRHAGPVGSRHWWTYASGPTRRLNRQPICGRFSGLISIGLIHVALSLRLIYSGPRSGRSGMSPVGWEALGQWGEDVARIERLAGGVANDVWSVRIHGDLAVGRLG